MKEREDSAAQALVDLSRKHKLPACIAGKFIVLVEDEAKVTVRIAKEAKKRRHPENEN